MNRTDRRISMRQWTGVSTRGLVIRVLLLVLVLAPALHLAGDGRMASSTTTNVHASNLCSVSGLTPTPLAVSPITAIARVPEALVATAPWLPTRPADHPPRP